MEVGVSAKASPLSVHVFPSTLNLRELTSSIENMPAGNVPTTSHVSRVIRTFRKIVMETLFLPPHSQVTWCVYHQQWLPMAGCRGPVAVQDLTKVERMVLRFSIYCFDLLPPIHGCNNVQSRSWLSCFLEWVNEKTRGGNTFSFIVYHQSVETQSFFRNCVLSTFGKVLLHFCTNQK